MAEKPNKILPNLLFASVGLILPLWLAGCLFHSPDKAQEHCCALGFRVEKIHLQPAFTKMLAPAVNQNLPAAIDAFVELNDQFGDPIKDVGTFRFEIFQYRPTVQDPRGTRFADDGIQDIDLSDPQTNQQQWDNITRGYHFRLPLPQLPPDTQKIVLQVTFTSNTGFRLQDLLIIQR